MLARAGEGSFGLRKLCRQALLSRGTQARSLRVWSATQKKLREFCLFVWWGDCSRVARLATGVDTRDEIGAMSAMSAMVTQCR